MAEKKHLHLLPNTEGEATKLLYNPLHKSSILCIELMFEVVPIKHWPLTVHPE